MYYSIRWERIQARFNIIRVRVTFLDEQGRQHTIQKYYEEWIGVCTRHIERVVQAIQLHFPGSRVLYQRVGEAKKILPYFEERLARGKLEYRSKPFYKLYTTASIKNVGRFFNRFKMGYYAPEDWLTRIYIDFCFRYQCFSFYYRWYDLKHDSEALLDALVPVQLDQLPPQPDWTFAAFDLESVPLVGQHVPMGLYATDRIVMTSLYKWNRRDGVRRFLLYMLPEGVSQPLAYDADVATVEAFQSEREMLVRFHELLDDADVLTGYNINAFDFPCLFARLLWLNLTSILQHYRSQHVGSDVVVSYRSKITVDLYAYVKTFSGYDLPSYKLDDVARVKLQGEAKLSVKATGIWSWYRQQSMSQALFEEENAERCFRALKPETVSRAQDFGTFRTYLEYCLKDSELVYRLFEKEYVLSFLVERANFTALSAVEALHFGNSRYLLELFKTYGTRLGYFINPKFFKVDPAKYQQLLGGARTYQGALNYCIPGKMYEDVSVLDFASMYPSALVSSNLCYGTCTILSREDWSALPPLQRQRLRCIPYQQHSSADFQRKEQPREKFSYPAFDPEKHPFVIVCLPDQEAFLPHIVHHFLKMRQFHQREWKRTGDIYHYNVQLGIKILVNSLYGVMANKDSPLAYLPIAITIVTLARNQLLGSFHYLTSRGYDVCYADTDSLMVHRWPLDHADPVNTFLDLPSVELKFEQRMKRLLVLSKKRYIYERADGTLVPKGFQRKVNGLIEYMTWTILPPCWQRLREELEEEREEEEEEEEIEETAAEETAETAAAAEKKEKEEREKKEKEEKIKQKYASLGWVIWVNVLSEAQYRCRDPQKYAIYRKIKKLDQYTSETCIAVKYLRKYPNKPGDEHVELTYGRADVAATEAGNWVMDVEDCRWVDFEKLFVGQKKIFCMLLNRAFWKMNDPTYMPDMVLNGLRWKGFVHAEHLHRQVTGRGVLLLVETSVKYTFQMNDHLSSKNKFLSQHKKYVASGFVAERRKAVKGSKCPKAEKL